MKRRHGPVKWFDAKYLIATPWHGLTRVELAAHVRRLIVAERKCMLNEFPPRLRVRFTLLRRKTAARLVRLGGPIDPRVLTQSSSRMWSKALPGTPQRYSWPNVFTLVPASLK